jgi:hypothetical protein
VKLYILEPKREGRSLDGSDHVSSAKMTIGRCGSSDLENERPERGHVTWMDGQDPQAVDGPGFPLVCFF